MCTDLFFLEVKKFVNYFLKFLLYDFEIKIFFFEREGEILIWVVYWERND